MVWSKKREKGRKEGYWTEKWSFNIEMLSTGWRGDGVPSDNNIV